MDYDGASFTIDLSSVETAGLSAPLLGLADRPLSVGDCLGENAQAVFDLATLPPTGIPVIDGFEDDPSFFSSAVIVEYGDGSLDSSGCARRVVAAAPLEWTTPTIWPDLAVSDAGESSGAIGQVVGASSEGSGDYVTAAGDSLDAIAQRFRISVDQLNWLNPCRPIAYDRAGAYEGEVLTLSTAARGARKNQP